MLRRPLCAAALLLCLLMLMLMEILPPQAEDFSDRDRTEVTILGTVVSKEYKTSDDGSVRLLITLKDCEVEGWTEQPSGRVLCRAGDGTQEGAQALDALVKIGGSAVLRGKVYVYSEATNSGEFDARQYYQILGYTSFQLQSAELVSYSTQGSVLDDALYQVKRRFAEVLDACAEEEDAQILKAMLLGEKGSLSAEIKDLYQSSGIIHVLAISGLHISIIGMGLFRLLRRLHLPLPVSAAAAAVVMLLYGRMTGMSASSFRAIVMFLLQMLALVRHRTYDMLTGISVAAVLLLLQQPMYLYHTGFLFSFSAVLAIALLMPAFETKGMKILSVTLGTLPVQLISYHTFSLYSVVLNLLVLPMMSVVMVSGLAVLAFGCIWAPAGRLIGLLPHLILLFYKAICSGTGMLVWHQINVGAPYRWEILLYLVILSAIVLSKDVLETGWEHCIHRMEWALQSPDRRKRQPRERRETTGDREGDALHGRIEAPKSGRGSNPRRLRRPVAVRFEGTRRGMERFLCRHKALVPEAARILAAAAAVFVLCLRLHSGLSLHVIDVGQGDGLLLRSAEANILIDGGSTSKTSLSEYQLTPLLTYYGVSRLDYVVITHADSDHMNGALEVILQSRSHIDGPAGWFTDDSENGITIGTLCLPSAAESAQNDNYEELVAAAQEKGIPVVYLKEGDLLEGETLRIVCLHPESDSEYEEENEMSVTLWLEYGNFTALLTGDLEGEGETRFLEYMEETGRSLLAEEGEVIAVTLLKVAHHGSSGATSAEFLALFQPRLAAVSCGVNNGYGHPHEETLERLEEAGVQTVYDTRSGGEIIFHTDGNRLRIRSFGGAMTQTEE